jgi:hypothetical protein
MRVARLVPGSLRNLRSGALERGSEALRYPQCRKLQLARPPNALDVLSQAGELPPKMSRYSICQMPIAAFVASRTLNR